MDKSKYLIDGPIKLSLIGNRISLRSEATIGAHNLFLGQVRKDLINNRQVVSIDYTAYPEMVDVEADLIIAEVLAKYEDVYSIEILHSTGIVKSGENSLFVFVSSGHRKDAFRALELTVELIKKRFPVWKKEIFNDGSYQWPSNEDKKL